MYYDDESQALTFLSGFLLGAAVGVGIALLMAPQSGRRTRRRIKHSLEGVRNTAGDRLEDIGEDVMSAVDTSRRKLKL